MAEKRRVLIIRFSAIGDVAMTIPVVYSVAISNPDTEFLFLTRSSMARMMVNPPANLQVMGVNVHDPKYAGPWGLRRLYKKVKEFYHPTHIADLHGVIRSFWIRFWARMDGVKCASIRKSRSHRHALTRKLNKVLLPLPSQRARYGEVFSRLNLEMIGHFNSLFPCPPPLEGFPDFIPVEKKGIWVGIAPFAAHPGKIYPLNLMEDVVKELAEKGFNIFLFGSEGKEEEVLKKWGEKYNNIIVMAGKKLGFDKELALISHLDVMVSMDSANMHLASITGISVISIWGATHPYAGFKPYKQQDSNQIQLPMPCRPCSIYGNKKCYRKDYHCLNAISPAQILKRVYNVLGQGE